MSLLRTLVLGIAGRKRRYGRDLPLLYQSENARRNGSAATVSCVVQVPRDSLFSRCRSGHWMGFVPNAIHLLSGPRQQQFERSV